MIPDFGNISHACGGEPRGNANWTRITNPVMNQSQMLRRKDAERLVKLGRATWVGEDQLRLDLSHPANRRAMAIASSGYDMAEMRARGGDRPDLKILRRRDPERFAALWRGTRGTHTGKGALGRSRTDRTVPFPDAEIC
jgi:hypothetical protein